MTEEVWKTIDGWPNYEVSNLGRVKSYHDHGTTSGDDILKITNMPTSAGNDRLRVSLRDKNYRRGVTLKKLVADAFLPPPRGDEKWIRHKDGDSGNCAADNLYYSNKHPNAGSTPSRRKRHTGSVSL